ncbi:hypothetical protein FRB95_006238 [Tulasnella sp. JGI-2019a]|nr:hypothetical protein FRB95_006238 [Tulasnella sp. JGI-2019a]
MPGHSPHDIQNHIYSAFLNSATTDVSLRILAQGWAVEYHLHRLVLIQSGFFKSLFTRGFQESSRSQFNKDGEHRDVIDVHFDDPNITRAGEICISRLYGGGPTLSVSPSLIPSISSPLTSSFLTPTPMYIPPPPRHHPATPRFLLSLIATSMYLHIPSVMSQALSLVLSTLGPTTVIRYLDFALGNGIGESDGPGDLSCVLELQSVGKDIDLAVEGDAHSDYHPSPVLSATTHDHEDCSSEGSLPDTPARKHGCEGSCSDPHIHNNDSSVHVPDVEVTDADGNHKRASPGMAAFKPHFNYGLVGNKIGEACACWLARWSTDMLPYEEEFIAKGTVAPPPNQNHNVITARKSMTTFATSGATSVPHSPLVNLTSPAGTNQPPLRNATSTRFLEAAANNNTLVRDSTKRRATVSTDPVGAAAARLSSLASSSTSASKLSQAVLRPPAIWSRNGGMSARWVRGLISSDDLFVKGGEMERYELATRVVEMRRREILASKVAEEEEDIQEEEEEEEREWDILFRSGFYYSNLSLDDLLKIQNDVSPTTHRPFVPISVLQNAHWNQAVLRSHILSRPSVPGSPTHRPNRSVSPPASPLPTPASRFLGIEEVIESASSTSSFDPNAIRKTFSPVLSDGSRSLGGEPSPGAVSALVEEATGTVTSNASNGKKKEKQQPHVDEENFFGLALNGRKDAKELVNAGPEQYHDGKDSKWTETEPCRFSVEFWDVQAMKPSSRLYSNTVWCMGSLWNVYVQVVRKKVVGGPLSYQLGVYLQRQSFVESIPAHSVPNLPPSIPRSTAFTHSFSMSSADVSTAPTSTPTRRPWAVPAHSTSSSAFLPITRSMTTTPVGSPPRAMATTTTNHLSLNLTGAISTPGTPVAASTLSLAPSTTTSSSATSPPMPLPLTSTSPTTPHSPWRDPRQSIRAYFSINCPSATGASSTKFCSAPDSFNVTQSWGWKSSKAEEWIDFSDKEGVDTGAGRKPEWCSLRATIVVGVV